MTSLQPLDVPLAVYVHFPWCIKKCPYCDFNSHPLRDALPERRYLTALLRDIEEELESENQRVIETVFFGGGTPSLMSATTVSAIIDLLSHHGRLAADAEITLEANPGAADASRFTGYRRAGVNRLSIGIQSLNNRLLKQLGRVHDARQGRAAVETARVAGFENINTDLMFGLPTQSGADAAADLEAIIQLAPEHISYYQLTLEPNTSFFNKPPLLPQDDKIERMHEHGMERLREKGYFRYEVSAFAQYARQCAHNLNYWQFGDYLGVGAGAHGKLSTTGRVIRYCKPRHPKDYMERVTDFRLGQTDIGRDDLLFEFMLNALRLRDGFSLSLFSARTGIEDHILERRVEPLVSERLVHSADGRIRATVKGYRFLNDILERLLPKAA